MDSMEQKLTELKTELEQIVKNHNEALEVVNNCKTRIAQLQGAVAALSEFVETEEEATEAPVEVA